jgi:Flp pilus assembly protein CpaB
LNRRLLTGITIAIVGLGLIILGIFAISRIVRQSFAPLPAPTAMPELTTQVVVTSRDIALGSVLNTEDLRMVEVSNAAIPRNALTELDQALGRITTVHMIEGEMVLTHHLADPTNVSHDVGYVIGEDQVLMAFHPEDLMTDLSILQTGDIVDLLISSVQSVPILEIGPDGEPIEPLPGEDLPTEERLFTWDMMQKLQITAMVVEIVYEEEEAPEVVEGVQPTPGPQDITVRSYLLALNAQDALILKHLRDSGAQFDMVLRSPTSSELFELVPVSSEYIIDRYQLEIIK